MEKITTITPEQAARFGEWSKRWIKIGLSTEPADFGRATTAALRAYELANLKRPMIVLRMGSPYGATLGGALAWTMLKNLKGSQVESQVGSQVWSQVESQVGSQVESQVGSQVGSQVESQVWSQVGSQVWSQVESQVGSQVESQVGSQVRSQVRSQVGSQVGSQVRSQVWSQVGSQVWSQVESQVGSQVRSQVESQVGSQVRSQVWSQVGSQVRSATNNLYDGQLYASWGAHISFMRDVLGWRGSMLERFSINEDLILSCGCVWWHENILAISDRPTVINRDGEGRLHCETGPSIAYRDGWALHHWHGVSVPADWIEKRANLDPNDVIKVENVEQRAAGAEIVGWPKMLSVLKAKVINDSGSPDIGQLIELKLPGLENPGRFLKAVCPRNGVIVEGVPRVSDIDGLPINTALAAQAWRIGDPQSEYQHPSRRT